MKIQVKISWVGQSTIDQIFLLAYIRENRNIFWCAAALFCWIIWLQLLEEEVHPICSSIPFETQIFPEMWRIFNKKYLRQERNVLQTRSICPTRSPARVCSGLDCEAGFNVSIYSWDLCKQLSSSPFQPEYLLWLLGLRRWTSSTCSHNQLSPESKKGITMRSSGLMRQQKVSFQKFFLVH